jgi:26S proteasome regulatory subunit N5
MISNSRLLVKIVQLCFEAKNWKFLNDNVLILSKKHGFLKASVQKMVQEAMTFIEKTPDQKTKLELIDTLRTVTEGKVSLLWGHDI